MLSVIIPCYNREKLIGPTILSLEKFSADTLEVVVVDDGSTDNSVGVAQDALKELSSARITGRVVKGKHRGACAARNLGLRESRGDWVLFLDSDDPAEPEGLNRLMQVCRSANAPDIVYGWVWVIGENASEKWKKGTPVEKCRHIIFDHPWHTSAAIYRKSLLERSGPWDETLSLGDDWEFGARARLFTDKIYYEDVCVGYYVQHGHDRLSAQSFDRGKSRSVIRAALGIRRAARRRHRLDSELEKRIYRRLLVQSTELVTFASDPRGRELIAVCAKQKRDALASLVACALRMMPFQEFRYWVYERLRAKSLA